MGKVRVINRKGLLKTKPLEELKKIARKVGLPIKKGWEKADIVKAIIKKIEPKVKKKKKEPSIKTPKVATKKPAKKKVTPAQVATKKPAPTARLVRTKRPKKTVKVRVKKKITKKVAKKVTKKIKKLTPAVIPSAVPMHGDVPITPPLVKLPRIVQEPEDRIPQIPEENRIVLLARDPNWMFTYWEICDKTLKSFQEKLPNSYIALRGYDISGSTPEKPNRFFDIDVHKRIGNWHIEVNQPDREFLVDIGLLSSEGTFLTIARSNKILTPRESVEKTGMEDWITKEFYRVAYGVPMEELIKELRISS